MVLQLISMFVHGMVVLVVVVVVILMLSLCHVVAVPQLCVVVILARLCPTRGSATGVYAEAEGVNVICIPTVSVLNCLGDLACL